jgi:hypothetical protein
VRSSLAEQVRTARTALAEATHVLGDEPHIPADLKEKPAGDPEATVQLRTADVPKATSGAKPSPRPAAAQKPTGE